MDSSCLNLEPGDQDLMNSILTEDLFSDPDSMQNLFQELISELGRNEPSAVDDLQDELTLPLPE